MATSDPLRRLVFETLTPRVALNAQNVLVFENPISEFVTNARLPASSLNYRDVYFRQVSWVVDNQVKTSGLHPNGTEFLSSQRSLTIPETAVDAAIETVFDADSGFGYAVFANGDTQGVLWTSPNRPTLLGNVQPLAGYQLADETSIVALESNSKVRIVRFGAEGNELIAITIDGEDYSNATVSNGGLILLGNEQTQPVAVRISEQLEVEYITLDFPPNADLAIPAGVGRVAGNDYFVGTAINSSGETRLVTWDAQGKLTDQPNLVALKNVGAKKGSGAALLVETEQGVAVIVRDQALANSLGIAVDRLIVTADLPLLADRSYVVSNFTDVAERDGELFLTYVASDASGALIHGLVVASSNRFPSAWQNPVNAVDVSTNGEVSPLDALLVINELNRRKARSLTAEDLRESVRPDVNGDGAVSPIDALIVINRLNRSNRSNRQGEGEQSVSLNTPFIEPFAFDANRRVDRRSELQLSGGYPLNSPSENSVSSTRLAATMRKQTVVDTIVPEQYDQPEKGEMQVESETEKWTRATSVDAFNLVPGSTVSSRIRAFLSP